MSVKRQHHERGDTLIEVLMAMAILALVFVSTFSVLSKGVSLMYGSMERVEVRQALNQQVESLQYARDAYLQSQTPAAATMTDQDKAAATVWKTVRDATWAPDMLTIPELNDCSASNAFYITQQSGTLTAVNTIDHALADGFPSVGNGIWVQRLSSPLTAKVAYKDYYVKACWQPDASGVQQALSSVVRLYDN